MVNQKLRTARKEKCWTIEVAAEKVGVSWLTYSRWERGTQRPYLSTLDQLCTAFGRTPQELGFSDLIEESLPEKPGDVIPSIQSSTIITLTKEQAAVLLSLIGDDMNKFDPSRRAALLQFLAITGIAAAAPQALANTETWKPLLAPEIDPAKTNEATLQGLEKLLESCWQLSKENELTLAERLLPECMNKLIPLAQQPSKHQQAATQLVAQGYQLYSVLALHHNDLLVSELHCKQAVQYSLLSGNQNLLVPSLRRLADTYRYREQYPQLLQTYLQALQHLKGASPLLQSCVYRGLGIAYAYTGQKQEALTYLGMAHDTFPDYPEADPSFSFAEFDLPWLIMGEGMIYSQFGETKQALDAFERIKQPGLIVPERIRLEILNQQAKTAIVSGDLEQGLAYVEAGISGARSLGSQRRYNEAYENFRQMTVLWPQEKRVKALGELFH